MKMVQIRNMPEAMHRTLKSRAAAEGMSLSDYILRELESLASRPTWGEWMEQVRRDGPTTLKESSAEAIRAIRDAG